MRMTSLQYYQTIFDKAGDAIFVHDIGSVQFMDANEAAVELTGYSKSELTQMNVEKISAFQHGFDLHHALRKGQQAATTKDEAITFEWLIESQDQRHIPVEVCLKKVEIENKPKLLALVRNISEIKKYQYAL